MEPIRDIVVPIDLADPREDAIEWAIELAGQIGARLHLVHVYQLPTFALPDGAAVASASFDARQTDALRQELERLIGRHRTQGVRLDGHLVRGMPHTQIVRLAERLHASLIVMGTHGRRGLDRMLLGSVAEKVVRHASVPVLVVPPRARRQRHVA